jgi:hypothetical protein
MTNKQTIWDKYNEKYDHIWCLTGCEDIEGNPNRELIKQFFQKEILAILNRLEGQEDFYKVAPDPNGNEAQVFADGYNQAVKKHNSKLSQEREKLK